MSNIDPSQQSLSAILNKLGINSSEKSNVPKAKDQLGQEDFLKLMTTQLQIKTLLLQWKMVNLLHKWLNFLP